MKNLTMTVLLMSSLAHAQVFEPYKKVKCFDDVANRIYVLKVIDVGDEMGTIDVIKTGNRTQHFKAIFNENSEGSEFHALKNDEIPFTIFIPGNNLADAYYADGGDSRGLDCK